jgi:hypothetical protein
VVLKEGLTTPCCKNIRSLEREQPTSDLDRFLDLHKQQKMNNRFGMWNMRSLYRSGVLKTVAWELVRYRSDILGGKEAVLGKGGTERLEDYGYLFVWEGN